MTNLLKNSTNKQNTASRTTLSLTVTLETLGISPEPRSTGTSTLDTIGTVSTLAQTTSLSTSASKTSALPVLVHRVHNPVNTGVVTDLRMRRIDQNNFVILHSGILVDPVRVEYAQVGKFASSLLFSDGLLITLSLDLSDTLVLGLTVNHTTVVGALTSSTADTASNYDVTLLGLVTETVSLIGTSGTVDAGDFGALTVFPGADTKKETKGITLLVTPELFHIFIATHLELCMSLKMFEIEQSMDVVRKTNEHKRRNTYQYSMTEGNISVYQRANSQLATIIGDALVADTKLTGLDNEIVMGGAESYLLTKKSLFYSYLENLVEYL
jgi:hypothetical protein